MMKTLKYKGYEGMAEVDLERGVCCGKIIFIDDLITYESESAKNIQTEFEAAVDDYIATCEALGREALKPLSGAFNVRIAPEVHRKAKVRAIQDAVSLNEVVSRAIDCYLHGENKVVNHHNYVVVSPDEQISAFSAAVTAEEAYRGVISSVYN